MQTPHDPRPADGKFHEPASMKRILVVYYSQSGDVRRAAESFVEPLRSADRELVWSPIVPRVEYPSPWRNIHRFFNEMPECVLGLPPEIAPPASRPASI